MPVTFKFRFKLSRLINCLLFVCPFAFSYGPAHTPSYLAMGDKQNVTQAEIHNTVIFRELFRMTVLLFHFMLVKKKISFCFGLNFENLETFAKLVNTGEHCQIRSACSSYLCLKVTATVNLFQDKLSRLAADDKNFPKYVQ